MFGCVVKLEPVQNPFRFRWWEELVEARWVVGVQLILNEGNALSSRKVNVDQVTHAFCPISFGPAIRDLDMAPILQWRKEHEGVGHSFAAILIVVPFGLAWRHRQGLAGFAHQLLRAFVKANQRIPGIFWPLVDIQNILHVIDELGIRFGWDAPLFPEPGLEFVAV